MSTQFGFHSLSTSAARKRIEAAGISFQQRKLVKAREIAELVRRQREDRLQAEREAREARARAEAARRREELIARFGEAFALTKRRAKSLFEIIAEVADLHHVTADEIMGLRRASHIVLA